MGTEMTEPVILLGFDPETKHVKAVGMYPFEDMAREAVHLGSAPRGLMYALYTPRLGECVSVEFVEKALEAA